MDFPPSHGGIQTMAREIVARAARTSFSVIAPAEDGSQTFDESCRAHVRRVRAIAPGKRGFVLPLALAARNHIRREKPDAVLALHVLAAPAAVRAPAPLVLVSHGGELRSRRIAQVARWAFPRAARVVANSRFTRSEAVALGADAMKIHVLPVGAPDPVAVPQESADALRARLGGGRIVLSVARLEPHKGHDVLIRSLVSLPADVRLVLVGRGEMRATLEADAARLGVADRVVFAGAIEESELPSYYAAADAFALLSRATAGAVEGGGISLLEACAYGLPVVAGSSGGIPETILDSQTGLLVDAEDPAAAARALNRVLSDEGLARRLGDAARAMATGERSWNGFVERLEHVLDLAAERVRA
jgi:phosphatidylinositol alpha-1,6-mannosyltransferase